MNMMGFKRIKGKLCCEDVSLETIAQKTGTPVYIYSRKTILDNFHRLKQALSSVEHEICYSVKVNSNLAVLNVLAEVGSGFDIVSGGELFRVIRAGGDPRKIVFAGVGKTSAEIKEAICCRIAFFTVESVSELKRINNIASEMGEKANIAIRVNPDVDSQTHKYITTGRMENKFGLDIESAYSAYLTAAKMPAVNPVAIQMHIGSQIIHTAPYRQAVERIIPLIRRVQKAGIFLEVLDLGGGYGIVYNDENPATAEEYANRLLPVVKELDMKIYIEPGRFIAGNAGVMLTRVQYIKENPVKRFVIVDAGMNDLVRPSLYNAYHGINAVDLRAGKDVLYDVVGPVCESGDFFAKDRLLSPLQEGDLLAVMSAGAYGFVMCSNYNARPKPAEVLVSDGEFRIVRQRETYDDLIKGEMEI